MKECTEEYILYLIDENRKRIIAKLENCMCLDCYNMVKEQELTEKRC